MEGQLSRVLVLFVLTTSGFVHCDVLSDMLDYPGDLVHTVTPQDRSHVPSYVSLVYEAMDTLDRLNVNGSQQTVWAIEMLRESRRGMFLFYHYQLPPELSRTTIGRVELVSLVPGGSRSPVLTIQACTTRRAKCVRRRTVDALSMMLGDHLYSVYDITILLQNWLGEHVSPDVVHPFPVVMRALRSGIEPGRQDNIVAEISSPLLVVYANIDKLTELQQILLNPTQLQWARARRSTQFTMSPNDACSLVAWYIDFGDVGWDLFVQPVGYYGNMCVGRCHPGMLDDERVPMSNHAVIKAQLLESSAHTRGAMLDVECIPRELHPLTVIVKVQIDAYVIKNIPNMVVKSCECL